MEKNYSEDIFHLIHHCNNLSQKLVHWEHQHPNDEFAEMDIGGRQGVILRILLSENGITQKELTEQLNISSSSIGELLGKLEKNDYIERRSSTRDKRTFNIHLTESGRAAAETYNKVRDIAVREWGSDLTKDEQEQLLHLLGKFSLSLERHLTK